MSAVSTSSRSNRKPKGEGHSRRGEILAAAERIFVEFGYEGATIRKIAEEVGLSSTALYMHFADKGEILQEICRVAFEELIASTENLASEDRPPEVRLRGMIDAYVDFGFANPNAYRLIYLTRPEEAFEIGLDEALDVGAALIEWPERLGDDPARALGPDRLTITLEDRGDGRHATVSGAGAWAEKINAVVESLSKSLNV